MIEERGIEERIGYLTNLIGQKYDRETVWQESGVPKGYIDFVICASAGNIRRYVDGIGDLNPRFRDPEYAKTTKYGRLVVPPLFLAGVCGPYQNMAVDPKGRPFYSGSGWEFFQPILEDDNLDYRGIGTAAVELRESKFSGQMLISTGICEYRSQRGVVALVKGIVHHSNADQTAASMGKYKDIKPYKYSEEEIRKIEEDCEKEEMRGRQPRYWEDVIEGEYIPHIVNGPRDIMDTICWAQGCPGINWTKGRRIFRMMVKRGSGHWIYDPVTNVNYHLELPHLLTEYGKQVGAPGAYDLGRERECMVATLYDNWMGDDGFLWKYSNQFRRFVIVGDTNWYRAKVVRKYINDGKYCVDLEHWGDNQRGERTTTGEATVILPSRIHGPVKYPTPRSLEEVFTEMKPKA
jgi:acyl dehydratase